MAILHELFVPPQAACLEGRIYSCEMYGNDKAMMGGGTMNFLEERIQKDGIVKEGNVLKVDSFLNHQMDMGCSNGWERNLSGGLPEKGLIKY